MLRNSQAIILAADYGIAESTIVPTPASAFPGVCRKNGEKIASAAVQKSASLLPQVHHPDF
jgi:hypothetical protein